MAKETNRAYEKPFTFCPCELSHFKVLENIFHKEKYEYLLGIENVNLIVDCGAHIGAASYYLKSHYPNAALMAFEAEEKNFQYLETNFSEANSRGFPSAYHLVIHPFRTEVGVYCAAGTTGWKVIEGRRDICTFPLNEIFTLGYKQIDILKISINGGEKFLFEKNTQWIEKTRNIAVEVESNLQVILETMSQYSYEVKEKNNVIFFLNIKKH